MLEVPTEHMPEQKRTSTQCLELYLYQLLQLDKSSLLLQIFLCIQSRPRTQVTPPGGRLSICSPPCTKQTSWDSFTTF